MSRPSLRVTEPSDTSAAEAAAAASDHLPRAVRRIDGSNDLGPEWLPQAIAQMAPFYLTDLEGRIVYANSACRRLLEQEPEISGQAIFALPFPLDEVIEDLSAAGGKVLREIALGRPTPAHWRVEHTGIYSPDGELVGIAGVFAEISALIASRHRLSITHERLEDLTRLVSDWIWETDQELKLTFVSPRASEVLGHQPAELIGHSFLELGQFTGAAPLDPQRRKPFRDHPFTILHRNGSQRLFHISALPVFCTLTGSFQGFRGTARDITEQAEAANRAAQSQSQLAEALESISEGFTLFDQEDRLVLSNRKFRREFSAIGDRIVPGMRFQDFLHEALAAGEIDVPEAERAAWLEHRMRLRAEDRASFEFRFGSGRWVKITEHKTADGSTVGIHTDITDLKHREEALFAAKEAAEIASRSKSEFLANISHELRTPLNAIIGFSEIMREEIFGPLGSEQYREYIGDVLDSAHHLLDVINDILDIAKAEAGKLELSEDEIEIETIVRSATRLIQERAQRGQIAIHNQLPKDLPLVHADERKLKQILLNLLTNAVKFTPPGGRIEITAGLAEGGDLTIAVADTGIGIAEEHIATALAPFGQVDSKLSRKYEGTGLGLPLSSAMMKLHQGALSITSAVGSGTTVTLRFPASRVRPPSEGRAFG